MLATLALVLLLALLPWAIKRRRPSYAPFCTNPNCRCALPAPTACAACDPVLDSAGNVRCACCGHYPSDHKEKA